MSDSAATASGPRAHPALARDAHKGDAGRLLCVVGSATMPGAAILVLRAAQRAGAGLVTLGCLDRELLGLVPVAVPEAIYVDLAGGEVRWEALLAGRADHARVVGCGLGESARTRQVVERVLADRSEVPLVLDADALNVLEGEPERIAAAGAPVVITPHPGEAGRLLGAPVPRDGAGRVDAARRLADRIGAICCLKGAGTVVAAGDRVHVNDTGNPGMATAGSGDVLSGILGAYLARSSSVAGWSSFEAAVAAVRVHGLAGDLAAGELGETALVASDLVDFLPAAQLAAGLDTSTEG